MVSSIYVNERVCSPSPQISILWFPLNFALATLRQIAAGAFSLRHTYAYLLKTSGVHVTTAQKLMGHADPGVTLGIYTRFRDEEIDDAGAAIRDSLRGKSDYLMF